MIDWKVFHPRNLFEGITILFAVAIFSFGSWTYTASAILILNYLFWITVTRPQRGYWLIKPVDPVVTRIEKPHTVTFDPALTKLYRGIFETENIMVSLEDASQYQIHVIWHNGLNIASKIVAIALSLGIKSLPGKTGKEAIPVILFEVWRSGCSAILIKKHPDQWGDPVTFKPEKLTNGKPRAYIGDAIDGEAIVIDHGIEHGALVAGTSGSGKTEVFVAHHRSFQLNGTNPKSIIIDLKGTPQLRRLKVDKYITDIETAIEQMRLIKAVLEVRMETYSRADCDNIWQYRKKVDPKEQPYCLYLDELAVLSRTAKAAGKDEPAAEAMDILAALAQLGRSSGLIIMVGMQHPLADDIPTPIRNQLMIRIVLAVADDSAAKVAGIPGAQNQPMQGAMIVKHANRIQIGRGAYIPSGD